jgi:hypothetical protein
MSDMQQVLVKYAACPQASKTRQEFALEWALFDDDERRLRMPRSI